MHGLRRPCKILSSSAECNARARRTLARLVPSFLQSRNGIACTARALIPFLGFGVLNDRLQTWYQRWSRFFDCAQDDRT